MTDERRARRTPLVLLVNHQEWTARSVESVLRPAGYAVIKAYTGRQATEVAARLRPDLVVVDYKLSDTWGLDTCRAIRELPTVDNATPFIIVTSASLSRRERHECFQQGIWDIFSSPFDPVELVGKLESFLSARREVEDAWESTHRDPTTGLYNWNGLLARAVELVADAQRSGRWTGCVAIGPRGGRPGRPELFGRITTAFAGVTRGSDPSGILGTSDFLVLAPGTDEEGTGILAQRVVDTLNSEAVDEERRPAGLEFSAGYYAALNDREGSLLAQDLLGRSMEALRAAQNADAGANAVLPFALA